MKSSSATSSQHAQNVSLSATANAAICQQTAYECLHNKATSVELKTRSFWLSVQEELDALSDHEDFSQAAIPLHLTQKILQEEADFMGFPSVPCGATIPPEGGPHLDTADKSASAALSILCEMFILEFSHRASHMRESNGILSKDDVKAVIKTTEIYDLFLDHLNN